MKTKLTNKKILEILGTDSRYVSCDQIGALSRDQIGWLSRDQIGWLSRDQIGGLSCDQIGWLSRDQIGWLSRDQIGWLSRDQIGWLSEECQQAIGLKDVPTLEQPYTKILKAINGGKNLEMSAWHSCNTMHCIGGWTVVLTKGGKELERKLNSTATAARMILRASRPDAPLPNFNASNEAAMALHQGSRRRRTSPTQRTLSMNEPQNQIAKKAPAALKKASALEVMARVCQLMPTNSMPH